MCAGTMYWANIGRLVYGFEETKLLALTGDHAGEPDDDALLAHRTRLRPKEDQVVGPIPEIEDELIAPHRDFWTR